MRGIVLDLRGPPCTLSSHIHTYTHVHYTCVNIYIYIYIYIYTHVIYIYTYMHIRRPSAAPPPTAHLQTPEVHVRGIEIDVAEVAGNCPRLLIATAMKTLGIIMDYQNQNLTITALKHALC